MKKTLLILLSCITIVSSGFAQTFTTTKDTVVATYSALTPEIHNDIKAAGASLYITWKVTSTNFPASWTDSASLGICDASACIQNSGNQITNGSSHSGPNPYTAGVAGDFHVLLNLNSAAVTGTYYMTVNLKASTSMGGTSVYEKNVTFIVGKYATGVKNVAKADDAVSLYPNPAKDVLNINYTGAGNVKMISIFNVIGKNVQNTRVSSNNTALDIDALPSGIYYARIVDGNGVVVATRRFTHQ